MTWLPVMTNVKKTTLTTMYKIKTTFALMLVSVVLFKIVEMKNHINVNIRNRSKDLELHEHKRASEVVFYVSERKIKILPKRIQCTDIFDVSISTWIYLMDWNAHDKPAVFCTVSFQIKLVILWENGLQWSISPATNMVNWNNVMQIHHLQLYFVLVSPQIIGSGFMDLQHC